MESRVEVDHGIKDLASRAPDKLCGAAADLKVHASDNAMTRTRMVVLDHLFKDAGLALLVSVVGLGRESASIAKYPGP